MEWKMQTDSLYWTLFTRACECRFKNCIPFNRTVGMNGLCLPCRGQSQIPNVVELPLLPLLPHVNLQRVISSVRHY